MRRPAANTRSARGDGRPKARSRAPVYEAIKTGDGSRETVDPSFRTPVSGLPSAGLLPGALPVALAGAAVPELRRELVLLGLRGQLGRGVLAAQALVGLGQHLVRAAGARGGVERVVVAAGLAHHDRLGDREPVEPLLDG